MDFQVEPLQVPEPQHDEQDVLDVLTSWWIRNWGKVVLIIGVLLISIVSALFLITNPFSQSDVGVSIEAPEEVSSGELVTYKVKIENRNSDALEDVRVVFFYPSGSVPIRDGAVVNSSTETLTLGRLLGNDKAEYEFSAVVIGEIGATVQSHATVHFRPTDLESVFQETGDASSTISNIDIPFDIVAPQSAVSGQEVTYQIRYANDSDHSYNDLRFVVRYPDGFAVIERSPRADTVNTREGRDIWNLAQLDPGEEGVLQIRGTLSDNERETKELSVSLQRILDSEGSEEYVDFERETFVSVMSRPPLALDITVNGQVDHIAHVDDRLEYQLSFKNNSEINMSGVVISAYLDGAMFVPSTVRTDGFYDSRTNTIFWSASSNPSLGVLRGGSTGTVSFTVNLRDGFPVSSLGTSGSKVRVEAEIETADVPAQFGVARLYAAATNDTKITTDPTFQSTALVNDAQWGGGGPFAPVLDERTIYTVHWKVTNPVNTISPAMVTARLAPGVEWLSKTRSSQAVPVPVYNANSQVISWDIGSVQSGAGGSQPAYEAYFQIAFTPSVNQVGSSPALVREITFNGTDVFTGEVIGFSPPILTTDSVVDSNERGIVQP